MPYPKFFQPWAWTFLTPNTLPYIIQPFWSTGPFVLAFTLLVSLLVSVSSPFSPSSPPMALLGIIWTLLDVPASAHTLPFIYSRLSPPPYLGTVMFFLFCLFFLIDHSSRVMKVPDVSLCLRSIIDVITGGMGPCDAGVRVILS